MWTGAASTGLTPGYWSRPPQSPPSGDVASTSEYQRPLHGQFPRAAGRRGWARRAGTSSAAPTVRLQSVKGPGGEGRRGDGRLGGGHGVTGDSAAGLWPLAEAKLATPRQRTGLVDRPRITQILDAGADAALTLVAAPPGFGKSTAVRTWCASRTEPPAWVTLDARDNDPVRLWTYVATAVDRLRPGLGRRALGQLGATADVTGPLDDLLSGIGGLGTELVIVLDDVQTVTDREAVASIDY